MVLYFNIWIFDFILIYILFLLHVFFIVLCLIALFLWILLAINCDTHTIITCACVSSVLVIDTAPNQSEEQAWLKQTNKRLEGSTTMQK